jgi:hypothetical protein
MDPCHDQDPSQLSSFRVPYETTYSLMGQITSQNAGTAACAGTASADVRFVAEAPSLSYDWSIREVTVKPLDFLAIETKTASIGDEHCSSERTGRPLEPCSLR